MLDTSAFLWFCADDERLSADARESISDGLNTIIVSAATVWEISIKFARNRLPELGAEPPEEYIPLRMAGYEFNALPISFEHAYRVAHLPQLHRDPFDRLLIAQAVEENLPVITPDPQFADYGVEVIW